VDAGFKKAKKAIAPERLRARALGEVPGHLRSQSDSFPGKIIDSEIPEYLLKPYPKPVEDAVVMGDVDFKNIARNRAGLRQVGELETTEHASQTNGGLAQVCRSGPFVHWMADEGPTNFVLPPDPLVTTVQWVPGIYYTCEDTVHPFR
jgi:hypothetical protein